MSGINGHDMRAPIVKPELSPSEKETLELVKALGELMIRMNKILMLMAEQQTDLVNEIRSIGSRE